MDDTAQTSSVPTPTTPVPPPVTQTPPVQPVTRPIEPPPSISRGPEGGPVRSGPPMREAAPIDEADAVPTVSDDSSDVIDDPADAASNAAETPLSGAEVQAVPEQAIEVQDSHPPVEVSEALQAAGVEKGPDAEKDQLPEEKQEVDVPDSPEQQQANAKQALAKSLPIDYVQAVQIKKASKIRDSAKWLANLVKRQWEIIQGKPK